MIKNNFKLWFFFMMFFSTLFIISSNSWLTMWLWLEINLISFISLISTIKNPLTIESSLIYFIIQAMASIILLYSIFSSMLFNKMFYLSPLALLIKLGSAPFHFWMPLMSEGLNWFLFYLLITWQKLGPFLMLYLINIIKYLIIFIFLSSMIGSFTGLNNSSMKKILSFSSINQIGWLLTTLMLINKIWKLYFLFYFYMMFLIIKSMKFFNIKKINQMFLLNTKKNKFLLLFIFMNMLSLGGLPPFLGFFPKMMIIFNLNNNFLMIILILFTLITLFFYLRIIYSMFLLNSTKMNLMNEKKKKKNLTNIFLSIFSNLMLIFMFILY